MQRQLQSCLCGAVAIGAFTLFAEGCSTSTTNTDVWRDSSHTAGPMRSLVVFGGRMDAAKRRTLEDGFVSALAAHGVHAVASYALFPELPSKVVARAAMQQDGADGYLVAVMRGKSEKTTFVPGYGFWGDFYGPNWGDEGGEPGYLVTNEFVNFWTSLWSSHGDGTLVWSAITETENPSSGMDFTASLLNKVIPALTQAGLITAEQMSVSYAPIPTAP